MFPISLKELRKLADNGGKEAQYQLGAYYFAGCNVEKDSAEAIYWFGKAARNGHAEAQFNLGNSYSKGEGVKNNPAEAVRFWLMAAAQNHPWAQYFLGACYHKGNGIGKELTKAELHYKGAFRTLTDSELLQKFQASSARGETKEEIASLLNNVRAALAKIQEEISLSGPAAAP